MVASVASPSDLAPGPLGARSGGAGRLLRPIAILAGRAIGVLAVMAIAAGYLLGFRAEAVLSGSMQPTYYVGDLVISKQVHVDQLRRGDIVTFSNNGGKSTTTHRVVSVTRSGAGIRVVTKGDANRTTEQWMAKPDGTVGMSVFHLRYAGRLLLLARQNWFRPVLVSITAITALAWLLTRLWRPKKPRAVPDHQQ